MYVCMYVCMYYKEQYSIHALDVTYFIAVNIHYIYILYIKEGY